MILVTLYMEGFTAAVLQEEQGFTEESWYLPLNWIFSISSLVMLMFNFMFGYQWYLQY